MSRISASDFRTMKVIVGIAVCTLFSAPSLFAQGEQVFKGQITQCSCAAPDEHAAMPDKVEPCSHAHPLAQMRAVSTCFPAPITKSPSTSTSRIFPGLLPGNMFS
jgi:hypothetical protein